MKKQASTMGHGRASCLRLVREARSVLCVGALGMVLFGAAGCAPKVWAASAIQPSQPGDTKDVWIYLHTNDDAVDGVYRCYDGEQKPVCKRATLVTK